MSLKDSIARLAESFASSVLAAVKSASLQDIAALSGASGSRSAAPSGAGRKGGRGRPAADVSATSAQVVDLVRGSSEGLRQEQIRDELGIDKKIAVRVIGQLLASGALRKVGQKRATKYFAGSGSAPAGDGAKKSAGKRRGKRGAKRGAKRGGKKG